MLKKIMISSLALSLICGCSSPTKNVQEALSTEIEVEVDPTAVEEALVGNFWTFNGGSETKVNLLQFAEGNAYIIMGEINGNGSYESGRLVYPFVVESSEIIINPDGDDEAIRIPYVLNDGKIKLGDGEYFDQEDVLEQLQGSWTLRYHTDQVAGIELNQTTEMNVVIDGNTYTLEKANTGINLPVGEYYYFIEEEEFMVQPADLTVTDGNYSTKLIYNIIDGEVVLMYYTRPFERSDIGLRGQDGYEF